MVTKELTADNYPDFLNLMQSSESSKRCMCMWWIISVKEYHANGHDGNAKQFCRLLETEKHPMGILVYDNDVAVGWCACGPGKRYARAIKTPTFKGRDESEDENVWLLPCFYIRQEYRGAGLTEILIKEAVRFAKKNGALAIEGFPWCTNKKISSGDTQAGFDMVFEKQGFKHSRQNSGQRVVVRLDF